MSLVARTLGRAVGAPLRRAAAREQRRFAGDMPAKPNKFVEDWATRREHLEQEFRWDGKNIARIAVFGFAIPIAVYKFIVEEYNTLDKAAGRPARDMWGSDSR